MDRSRCKSHAALPRINVERSHCLWPTLSFSAKEFCVRGIWTRLLFTVCFLPIVSGCASSGTGDAPSRLPRPWRLTTPFRRLSPTPATAGRSSGAMLARSSSEVATGDNEETAGPSENGLWHVDFGFRTGYTKLGSTKQQLDRRLDLPMKLDVLGVFDSPETPLDRKSSFGLNTIYLGLGYQQADWLIWTLFAGGGAGRESDHQRFLNLNLDVDFDYAYYYVGVQCELYPWGTPDYLNHLDLPQALQASRPYVITGFETGYVDARGKGEFSFAPFRIYEDEVNIRDWLFSYLLGVGWALPLSDNWSINVSSHYSFHFYRPNEYNTWNFVSALRYRL